MDEHHSLAQHLEVSGVSAGDSEHVLSQSRPHTPSPGGENWWNSRYDFAAKIIILGNYGVGKTTLLNTLGNLEEPEDSAGCRCTAFRPGEYVEMEAVRNNKRVLIRIMDTGGQERFRSITSSYFRGAHGCLLMFDVTNEESFDSMMNWYNDLNVYAAADHINALLVGTTTSHRERRVSAERAFKLAEQLQITYAETNVRDQQTVLWILQRLVNSVIVSRARRQSLAITIMPTLRERPAKKKKIKCCVF
ncbi:hypothetical protein BaRGS_00028682 [Batillaria attramentaria]|uniref:Uncharacterized protein n=1 Tax=Batillaria attramentaria TaxID=370345 RepID=A0ABD0JZ97_9CAEN|nr:hypothetical protein BaRGS_002224 [Batillaria attramentaria]